MHSEQDKDRIMANLKQLKGQETYKGKPEEVPDTEGGRINSCNTVMKVSNSANNARIMIPKTFRKKEMADGCQRKKR